MDNFDLGRLTDFDFEVVMKDVFEDILGQRLEIFAPGADGGADLRRMTSQDGLTVVQCKHWMRSGRAALIRHVERVESAKVRKLQPDRYLLATSVELTAAAKSKLMGALSPFVRAPEDVWGIDEISAFLRDRPKIVRRHFRLWLSSTQVLESLFAKEIMLRSHALRVEIDRTLRLFAPSDALELARVILDSQNVCIIVGIPGVGKTTLAQVLAAEYLADGYELFELSGDVDEALRVWDEESKQVFYYDDFLGQTSLRDTTAKNEDSRLVRFVEQVNRADNKKFILTSREYILAQARQASEKLSSRRLDLLSCVLDVSQYKNHARAEVLYNHIYFSDLPSDNRAAFADPDVYRPLINHRNFNPRLIALTFDSPESSDESPADSVARLQRNLDSPSALWTHMFDYQLQPKEEDLVEVLYTFRRDLSLDFLRELWLDYSDCVSAASAGRDLRTAARALEGTLLRIDAPGTGRDTTVGIHNPSVRDFMRARLGERPELLAKMLGRISRFEQIATLWTVAVGYDGAETLALIDANERLFVGVAARLLRRVVDGFEELTWTTAAQLALEMSEHLGSDELRDLVDELLAKNLTTDIEDHDQTVAVINALRESKWTTLRRFVEPLTEALVSDVMSDISDWDNARWAEGVLDGLDVPSARSALESIRERLDEQAKEAAAWAAENGDYPSSLNEAEEMLDVLRGFYRPEESIRGFGALVSAVERANAMRPRETRSSAPTPVLPSSVEAMMSTLRQH